MATTFDLNPPPQAGRGAFGQVPGAIGLPDPFSDVNKAIGGDLPAANKLASTDILAELGGNVSPGTLNALTLAAAQRGVGSGMGGMSGLSTQDLFGNIAGFSEAQQQKGFQNYGTFVPTVSKTQTVDPALQSEIASRNATFGAAPDPAQAASYARQLFEEYLNKFRGGPSTPRGGYTIVGSPAGGTTPTTPPRSPGYGGGGGGVGLPAGGTPFQPGDFEAIFGGADFGLPAGGYTAGESPLAPTTYAGDYMGTTPPPAGGVNWSDPFGVLGGASPGGAGYGQMGGADLITAPDLANDFFDSF